MRIATNSRLAKLSPQHELLALTMIQHPDWTNSQLGEFVGFSKEYVSVVINSDTFRERYHELAESLGERVIGDAADKIKAAAMDIVDVIRQKINRPPDEVSERFLVDAAKVVLPYAIPTVPTKGDAPTVNINFGHVTPEDLAAAQARRQARFNVELPAAPAELPAQADELDLEFESVSAIQ